MTRNHTCPTCRKKFTCARDDCSEDDLCYECLLAERDRLLREVDLLKGTLLAIRNNATAVLGENKP